MLLGSKLSLLEEAYLFSCTCWTWLKSFQTFAAIKICTIKIKVKHQKRGVRSSKWSLTSQLILLWTTKDWPAIRNNGHIKCGIFRKPAKNNWVFPTSYASKAITCLPSSQVTFCSSTYYKLPFTFYHWREIFILKFTDFDFAFGWGVPQKCTKAIYLFTDQVWREVNEPAWCLLLTPWDFFVL